MHLLTRANSTEKRGRKVTGLRSQGYRLYDSGTTGRLTVRQCACAHFARQYSPKSPLSQKQTGQAIVAWQRMHAEDARQHGQILLYKGYSGKMQPIKTQHTNLRDGNALPGVDLQARERIHELLIALRVAGMAILFSTHDFDQAAEVADRAAFLFGGQLLLEGEVRALIHNTFGDAKEVVVELAAPADDAAREVFSANRLRVSADQRAWAGPLSGGYGALAELEQSLEQAGAHVAQIHVRDPGLGGVFRQLVEQQRVAA